MENPVSILLDTIATLAKTQDHFWEQAHEHAQIVELHEIKKTNMLKRELFHSRTGFRPVPKDCFANAWKYSFWLKRFGVKYVEGFVLSNGKIFSHAWISYRGRYYDPTYEYIASLCNNDSNWRDNYVHLKILEAPLMTVARKCYPDDTYDTEFAFREHASLYHCFERHHPKKYHFSGVTPDAAIRRYMD